MSVILVPVSKDPLKKKMIQYCTVRESEIRNAETVMTLDIS